MNDLSLLMPPLLSWMCVFSVAFLGFGRSFLHRCRLGTLRRQRQMQRLHRRQRLVVDPVATCDQAIMLIKQLLSAAPLPAIDQGDQALMLVAQLAVIEIAAVE